MSGWPNRISRAALGARKVDRAAIINPTNCIPANEYNLLAWQGIGAALTAPVAMVLISASGALLSSAEAWNPNSDPTLRPTTSRTAAGVYVVTYAPTYPDEGGVQTPLVILAGEASPQGGATLLGSVSFSGNVATIGVVDLSSALTDSIVFLRVW